MSKKILTSAAGVLVVVAALALYQMGVIDLGPQESDQSGTGGTAANGAPTEGAGETPANGSPDADGALQLLEELSIVEENDPPGYDRSLFPHWESGVRDNCTARQVVLLRDGENVEVDDECQPVSGTWYSEYDGETLNEAGDIDIDHMVPLKEAWRSGASEWTTAERERFANDLDASPQLWAVSASSNRSKSDEDPGDWLPPLESFHCDYAVSWIEVKHTWELTVDPDEARALREVLAGC
ncbi:HNH endonuclease family protein [Nocardiopsis lucentensis]|uniref:HNH endonuclease family protein n=1 Tax=Nocardiopsis lucentensis TaxID=53441 RepID=UPI00034BB926|nr:HNH endonuclease family protein [Nocardiopsis lucentensis]